MWILSPTAARVAKSGMFAVSTGEFRRKGLISFRGITDTTDTGGKSRTCVTTVQGPVDRVTRFSRQIAGHASTEKRATLEPAATPATIIRQFVRAPDDGGARRCLSMDRRQLSGCRRRKTAAPHPLKTAAPWTRGKFFQRRLGGQCHEQSAAPRVRQRPIVPRNRATRIRVSRVCAARTCSDRTGTGVRSSATYGDWAILGGDSGLAPASRATNAENPGLCRGLAASAAGRGVCRLRRRSDRSASAGQSAGQFPSHRRFCVGGE